MTHLSTPFSSRKQRIASLLQPLRPAALEIHDDSHKHAGHAAMQGIGAGGETHFRIAIASPLFTGKSRVEQHRMVQSLLQPEFDSGLHALQIQIIKQ